MNAKTLSRFDLARTAAHTVVAGEPNVTSTARRWIAGPWRDSVLLVGLPLLILPAFALILGAGLSDERQLNAWVFALGAQGHHLPGWLRAYGDKAVFSAYRQRLIWGPAVIVSLSVGFALADLHALVLMAYLWGVWHGLMQTYGVARIYGRMNGASEQLARWDLLVCQVGFIAAVLASPVRQHYILDLALRIGLNIPDAAALEALRTVAVLAALAAAAGWVVTNLRAGWRQAHPARLVLIPSSLAFWWFCNLTVEHMLIGLALFEVFHDLQYLALVWWVGRARHQQGAGGRSARWLYGRGVLSIGLYAAACLLYGALVPIGEAGSTFQRIGVGVLAASQLVHFYFDGFIWRLGETTHSGWLRQDGSKSQRRHHARPALALAALSLILSAGVLERTQRSRPEDRIVRLAGVIPESPILQTQLGALHLQRDALLDAAGAYRAALALIPEYDLASDGLEHVLRRAAETGELHQLAAPDCEPFASTQYAALAFKTGRLAIESDRPELARQAWHTALCMDPRHTAASHSLGVYYAQRGDYSAAAAILRRALERQPNEAQLRALLERVTDRPE